MIHHQQAQNQLPPFLTHEQHQHQQLTKQQTSSSPSSNDSSLDACQSSPLHQLDSHHHSQTIHFNSSDSTRVSPASTALVMSSNNINGQSLSRQLTPNTSSSNRGGTNSSSGTGRSLTNSPSSNTHNTNTNNQHRSSGPQLPPVKPQSRTSNQNNNNNKIAQQQHQHQQQQQAPNPMARQSFATYHTKSMSAGVVVPVPGISTNLGCAHRNVIKPNSHHPPNPHRPLPLDPELCQQQQQQQQMVSTIEQQQQQHHHQQQQALLNHQSAINQHSRSGSANLNHNGIQQQVIRENQTLNRNSTQHNHHNRHQSQPNSSTTQPNSQQQQLFNGTRQHRSDGQHQQHHNHHNGHHNGHHNHHHQQHQQGASFNVNNCVEHLQPTNQNAQTTTRSSILLSNRNINQQFHNRSASAQMIQHHNDSNINTNNNLTTSSNNQLMINNNQQLDHHHHHHQQQISTSDQNNNMNSNSNYPPCHIANTNSIWSIDENMSKSQRKLTSSGFITHPSCLFSASITDMSCDNISNALNPSGAGIPPPPPTSASAYYLAAHHHHSSTSNSRQQQQHQQLPNSQALSTNSGLSIKRPEFLPFCDLMFNFISMIIYFCENTFGIIALIAFYYHLHYTYFAILGTCFVLASNVICQYLSFKWLYRNKLDECYRKREAQEELEDEEGRERRCYGSSGAGANGGAAGGAMSSNIQAYRCNSCSWLPYNGTKVQIKFLLSTLIDGLLHILCLGILLRYIKLVIPITDTTRVKRDGRDLCMLRMTHGFIQSIPMLLLQSYLICSQVNTLTITNLSIISAILSLINVCWALASFTKYARKKYSHKFVLTWLGIVSQFMWRLGTISSRVVALTIYAVYFGYWMIVILFLHWMVMFVWLIQPGNLFKDETNSPTHKRSLSAIIVAWIYCFCYVNFEEMNSKIKIIVFYGIMFLENNLLLTLSLIFSTNTGWFRNISILIVYFGFAIGMSFMLLYYKHLHPTVLNNGLSCSHDSVDSIADQLTTAGKKIAGFKPGTLRLKSDDNFSTGHRFEGSMGPNLHTGSHPEITRTYLTSANQVDPNQASRVINCRPQPWVRKQKIPSSHQGLQ